MTALATVNGRGTLAARPAAGSPGRTYFVTDGTAALYRDNGSSWDSIEGAGGMTNPMTTAGDIIIGDTGGSPIRLAKGSDSQVLTIDPTTHLPVYATPAAGGGGLAPVKSGTTTIGASAQAAGLNFCKRITLTGTQPVIAVVAAIKGNDANLFDVMVGIANDDVGPDVGRWYAGATCRQLHMSSDTVRWFRVPLYYEPQSSGETIWAGFGLSGVGSIAYAAGGTDKTLPNGGYLSDVQGTGQGVTSATTNNYSIYVVQAA